MSDTEKECKVAPTGKHCLHARNNWWQWNATPDRTQVCCWCGQDIAVHGEFLPTYPPYGNSWTIQTTTQPNTTTQWVNVPTTFTANGHTFSDMQFNNFPSGSGSVGTGG